MPHIKGDIKVVFKTDELGTFQQIENLDEIIKTYSNYISKAQKELKADKEAIDVLDKLKNNYTSATYINNNLIGDLKNYYTFHGAKYELFDEYNSKMQMANNYGGEPFDADVKVSLDEIDSENNNYVVRAYQSINSDQLKTSVLNYLNDLNISQGKELLRFDQFGEMKGEIWIANRIHGSGWTTFSITTKEINFEGEKGIEEFIIKIK